MSAIPKVLLTILLTVLLTMVVNCCGSRVE